MNDYAEILQALADKFGTTVEHLWGVLINQAAISASVSLVTSVGLICAMIFGFRFIKMKTTRPEKTEDIHYPEAEWCEEGAVVGWVVFTIGSIISTIIVIESFQLIAAGFLNPEYWALMKLKG